MALLNHLEIQFFSVLDPARIAFCFVDKK